MHRPLTSANREYLGNRGRFCCMLRLNMSLHYCLIKGSSMLVFYAHGVGPVTLSGGFAESFFYGNSKPLPFTGRTETVSRKVGILECSRILRRSFPDNRFVFNNTFHRGNLHINDYTCIEQVIHSGDVLSRRNLFLRARNLSKSSDHNGLDFCNSLRVPWFSEDLEKQGERLLKKFNPVILRCCTR